MSYEGEEVFDDSITFGDFLDFYKENVLDFEIYVTEDHKFDPDTTTMTAKQWLAKLNHYIKRKNEL